MTLITSTTLRGKLGISRTSEWKLRKTDPHFPKPVLIGTQKHFVLEEADAYIASKIAERDAAVEV